MSESENERAPAQCRSCDARLHGPYCSACGESHVYGRLDLRALADDLIGGLVNLDSRVLRTIGDLSVAPAKVCRDYLDGRRIRYVDPMRYALVCFGFAFLVGQVLLQLQGVPEDPQVAELWSFGLRWGQVASFLVMPLLAAGLLGLFFNAPRKLRWIEHYVLVLFCFGHVALLQGLFGPLLPYFGAAGQVAFRILPIAYLSWMAVGVYGTRWWTTLPRVLAGYVGMLLVAGGLVWLVAPDVFPGW